MEREVRVRVFVDVGGHAAVLAECREQGAERGDVLVAGVLGQQPRGRALPRPPGRDDLHDLLAGLANHEDAATGNAPDQAVLLEADDRLADGGPANPELLGKAPLAKAA